MGARPCANVYSGWMERECFHKEESGLVLSRLELIRNSSVLPVGGLQRRSNTRLLSAFYELVRSGRASLYMYRTEKNSKVVFFVN